VAPPRVWVRPQDGARCPVGCLLPGGAAACPGASSGRGRAVRTLSQEGCRGTDWPGAQILPQGGRRGAERPGVGELPPGDRRVTGLPGIPSGQSPGYGAYVCFLWVNGERWGVIPARNANLRQLGLVTDSSLFRGIARLAYGRSRKPPTALAWALSETHAGRHLSDSAPAGSAHPAGAAHPLILPNELCARLQPRRSRVRVRHQACLYFCRGCF
jgi:hypothetical protein